MTGEELGYALLGEIEKTKTETLRPFALLLRKVLGLAEQADPGPSAPPQLKVRPEFPQLRIRYDASGKEIWRKRCETFEEFGLLARKDPEIACAFAMPVDTPEPETIGE